MDKDDANVGGLSGFVEFRVGGGGKLYLIPLP
jgi:hypothetical protein